MVSWMYNYSLPVWLSGSEGNCVFGSGVRVTAREEPDRIMLRSIKNTSSQVLQLLVPTAAALQASESLHTINQKRHSKLQTECLLSNRQPPHKSLYSFVQCNTSLLFTINKSLFASLSMYCWHSQWQLAIWIPVERRSVAVLYNMGFRWRQ